MVQSLSEKKITSEYIAARMRKKTFFARDCRYVAEHILGDILLIKKGRSVLAGKIVETEAYPGKEDDASHAFKGKNTKRTSTLYSQGGVAYVYFIYGKYWCFNIVTGKKGDPQSVFIRALEPVCGMEKMKKLRGTGDMGKLTCGPCRWTQAFAIDRTWSGRPLTSFSACILKQAGKKNNSARGQRIGVDYAEQGREEFLRFYLKDNPFVSKK